MELKQRLIHRKYHKAEATTQITIGDDYSIPEGKPDILSILQKKAECVIEEVHTEKGKIRMKGNLKADVLYTTQRSNESICSLNVQFSFDEILYMEGAVLGDNLKIDWNIEELRVTIIHPGKISVRALVAVRGMIMTTEASLVTENVETEGEVYVKTDSCLMAEPVFERKDSYRIHDEVQLPVNKPNIQEVLWKDLQIRGLDVRQQDGRLSVKGEALLFIVYKGEEEPSVIQWFEQAVSFHGTMEATGLTSEMFGIPQVEIAHWEIEAKPDYDGEMRLFQLDLLLDIHMHFYEEHSCNVLRDAYSTKEQLLLNEQEIPYEKLRICTQTKCRVQGTERTDESQRILQIIGHHAQLLSKQSKPEKTGILWEGELLVQVLYITDNDEQPFGAVSFVLPCSQLVEISGIGEEDRWDVQANLEQILISMPESNRMEVRGTIGLGTCVMETCHLQTICEIAAESYDMEEYKKSPGMKIHFVQPGETLWEIAKANRTTTEDIRKLNELQADEIVPGQKLLLVKQTEGAILR